jgi:anti-sigma factor RsiW
MSVLNSHLTDHDLLCGLDGELPDSRKGAVDRHLRECETCRRRQAAIEETATALSCAYRAEMDLGSSSPASRDRLKNRLAQAAQESVGTWSVSAALTPRGALAAGAAAAAIVGWLSVSILPLLPTANSGAPLPVASITPGATWDISAQELCAGTRHTRAVTAAMRAQVLSAHGMEDVPTDQYELDYLITPELGGATDARNLWPQAYASPVWNARVKDELESLLPRAGAIDLATAQRDMAVNWIAAYKKYFNTDHPLQAHRGPARGDDDDEVYALADARPAPAVRLVSLEPLSVRPVLRSSVRAF